MGQIANPFQPIVQGVTVDKKLLRSILDAAPTHKIGFQRVIEVRSVGMIIPVEDGQGRVTAHAKILVLGCFVQKIIKGIVRINTDQFICVETGG